MDAGQDQPEHPRPPLGVGQTAIAVAAARAAESRRSDRLFTDPLAAAFLTAAGLPLTDHPAPTATHPGNLRTMRLAAYAPIRTRFFDDCLLDACAHGCHQVVILAAGLDTRAFRLPWPAGVCLFELDTPQVLTFKEQVLTQQAARPACRRVTITADLRQDWATVLTQAGFAPGAPTVWLVEGLLPYLTHAENDRLLGQISMLSASGSRLALEYIDSHTTQLVSDALGASGEDAVFKALLCSGVNEDPQAWLGRHGWQGKMYDAFERAGCYGRALPGLADSAVARALQAGRSGLVIAYRPQAVRAGGASTV